MSTNILQAFRMALLTFTISLIISFLFGSSLTLWVSILALVVVIFAGIIFDIIGTAVTAATETPFHAMASDKVKGSRQAIYLVRHADQVANLCNDVVGDISGTIGGVLIAGVVLGLIHSHPSLKEKEQFINPFAIATVAAVTVAGKAFGKSLAIDRANDIVFAVGKLLAVFKINLDFNPKRGKKKSKYKSNLRKVKKG